MGERFRQKRVICLAMNCTYVSKYIFTGTPLEFARQCHNKEMAAFLVREKIYFFGRGRKMINKILILRKKLASFSKTFLQFKMVK